MTIIKKEYPKKAACLCIYHILKKYTDKTHYLTRDQILEYLKSDYNLECDRKIVNSSIETLELFGIYFTNDPKKGLAYVERDFEESEIRYLVDAIISSKYLSSDEAGDLIDKITSNLSIYEKDKYPAVAKSSIVVPNNFLNNLDIINTAIKEQKKIQFKYLSYDSSGKPINKHGDYTPIFSPYHLINNFGKYYLLGYFEGKTSFSPLKIDRMKDIEILEEERTKFKELEKLDINKYLNEHVYVYSSEIVKARLLIKDASAIGYVKENFPKAKIMNRNEQIIAEITCDETGLLFWCLQYIKSVKVISPIDLKYKIITTLKKAEQEYIALPQEPDDIIHFKLDQLINNWIDDELREIKETIYLDKKTIIKSLHDYLTDNVYEISINYSSLDYENITIDYLNNKYCIDIHYCEDVLDENMLNNYCDNFNNNFKNKNYTESYMLFVCLNINDIDKNIPMINGQEVKWNFYKTKGDDQWVCYTIVGRSKFEEK